MLKVGHYYKTKNVSNPNRNWMQDNYIKILRVDTNKEKNQTRYEVEVFELNDIKRRTKYPYECSWLMWEDFEKKHFVEISKEEYDSLKMLASL
jgi:hypothetical protein